MSKEDNMLTITKLCGKIKIQLDNEYCFVSSVLHNKIELYKNDKYVRDFTNLCSAFEYYWEHIDK
ncbi:hypothetical protein vBAcePPAc_0120 [Aeromonas phage vB_AceP_PAc]|nr:hypothetical protein vBAcePPAc_0120 [Aeromonas phage vB_AceP_PAc]